MASFTSNSLQQKHHHLLHSITTLCKYPSPLNVFEYHCPSHFFTFSPPKQTLQLKHTLKLYPLPLARGNINHIVAKSGSGTRTLDTVDSSGEETVELSRARDSESGNWDDTSGSDESAEKMEVSSGNRFDNDVDGASNEKRNLAWFSNGFVKRNSRLLDGLNNPTKVGDDGTGLEDGNVKQESNEIRVSEDVKKYALQRGFEIYEKMRLDGVAMNEAALTSVARMAMSMGDGDMAFDMVKQMKSMGINPRLRSYGPALSAFCSSGDIDKAWDMQGEPACIWRTCERDHVGYASFRQSLQV